ncbi:uncharacterized protein LOC135201248 isoform X2 [Macrobrachium nipponense]|uniref:uncharacterized protein LOC135201248 isoform X2 n=1 Tax=Macrobrachium nipponense TaxID=159736 RepID=UPI0030C883B2
MLIPWRFLFLMSSAIAHKEGCEKTNLVMPSVIRLPGYHSEWRETIGLIPSKSISWVLSLTILYFQRPNATNSSSSSFSQLASFTINHTKDDLQVTMGSDSNKTMTLSPSTFMPGRLNRLHIQVDDFGVHIKVLTSQTITPRWIKRFSVLDAASFHREDFEIYIQAENIEGADEFELVFGCGNKLALGGKDIQCMATASASAQDLPSSYQKAP